jgi:aminopeptidase N
MPGIEPVHMDLELRFDLAAKCVVGRAQVRCVGRVEGTAELALDAVDFDRLSGVSGDSHDLRARYDGERLKIQWAEPVPRGETRVVVLEWQVTAPVAGLVWRPSGVGRFVASDHETARARYWLPVVDHPLVRTTAGIELTHETGLTAVSAGRSMGTVHNGDGTSTTTWQLDERSPAYLICVVIGDLERADDGSFEGAPIAYFAPKPHTQETLLRSFGRTGEMLAYLTHKLGQPLPWPKYFQFAVPGIGGAMENVSLVSWDDAFMADPVLADELGWLIDLINLHEMAHTWFGDRIVCREFAHVWLKESWAVYMEAAWLEDTQGIDAMHGILHENSNAYRGESDGSYARPIQTRYFESGWDMYDRHLYPGGAVRLHQLRKLIGDDVFWTAVRAYVAKFDDDVVDTADFRKVLEEHSGRNLNRYFDQWFASPGYPKLTVEWDDGTLTIEQTQVDAAKHIGLFDLKLPVAVQVADGSWQRKTVSVTEAKTTVALDGVPLQIIVDPDHDTVHGLTLKVERDMLLRSLRAPTVYGRIQAGHALAAKGTRAGLQAIQDAWASESSGFVRRAWARGLGACPSAQAAAVLAHVLSVETEAWVLSVVTLACTNHRDPGLSQALQDWLAVPGRGYRASASALVALGKQREDAPMDVLTQHATDDTSWWGWVQQGALQGLGHTWNPDALATLRSVVGTGRAPARHGAISGIAELGRMQDRAGREVALELLREAAKDPDYRARMTAGAALGRLGESAGRGVLTQLESRVAAQDVPRLRRLSAGLGGSDTGGLTRQVEELRGELKRLHERLEKLDG